MSVRPDLEKDIVFTGTLVPNRIDMTFRPLEPNPVLDRSLMDEFEGRTGKEIEIHIPHPHLRIHDFREKLSGVIFKLQRPVVAHPRVNSFLQLLPR